MNKTDQIIELLLSYIIANKLKSGDKLPSEEELADRFNVSRVSIREGLRGLKFLGFARSYPRRGTIIQEMDFTLLGRAIGFQIAASDFTYRQLLEARLSIELGALDVIVGKLTPNDIAELKKVADCSRYSDDPTEIEYNLSRDCEFHRRLLAIGGNSILLVFSNLLQTFFAARITAPESSQQATRDHMQLIEALECGNLELARGIMRKHLHKYDNLFKAQS